MKALLLSILIVVLGTAGAYAPAAAVYEQPDVVVTASAGTTYSYFVSWDFDALGEGAFKSEGFDTELEYACKSFGFHKSPLPNRMNDVLCDTYITFYSDAAEKITATSANDLRGKGQVKFTGHWNWATKNLIIKSVEDSTWEISERLYDYLQARKNADDYCVSIAIYTSERDIQVPIEFKSAQKSAGGHAGTKLNYTLSRTAKEGRYVPGDFTDTTDKSGDGTIDESGELGGDANATKPIASGEPSLLDKIKAFLAELLGKSEDAISSAFAVVTIIFLSLLGLIVLILFLRIFRFLIPRRT